MEASDKLLFEITDLVIKGCENALSDDEFNRLQHLLKTDPIATEYYYETVLTFANMDVVKELDVNSSEPDFNNFFMEIAKQERTAPAIEIPKEKPPRELIQKVVYPSREKRQISKFSIFTLVMSVAAMLMMALFLRFAPDKKYRVEVATLLDQIDAKWAQSDTNLKTGSRLWTHEAPLQLNKGVVQIRYDDGVDVLVEGPAVFEVERSGIYLEYGRVYSSVSETGLGFTVTTPTAQFVDHGTEFGVQADINGSSELHVFKGKVQIFAGSKGKARAGRIVTTNEAVRYNANRNQIKTIPVAERAFVRNVKSETGTIWRGQMEIDLADIVSGGSGLMTTTQPKYIDPVTGEILTYPNRGRKSGDFIYHQVGENPFVDGVFVPSVEKGFPQVTSEGHVFEECSLTNNTSWGPVVNTKYFKGNAREDAVETMRISNVLSNSIEKLSQDALLMCPNQGITFDLDKIREANPYGSINGFRSNCLFDTPTKDRPNPNIDIWVLVDGQVRYQKIGLNRPGVMCPIHVEISDQNHFLSLIVTDGSDDDPVNDWGFFVEPVLILKND